MKISVKRKIKNTRITKFVSLFKHNLYKCNKHKKTIATKLFQRVFKFVRTCSLEYIYNLFVRLFIQIIVKTLVAAVASKFIRYSLNEDLRQYSSRFAAVLMHFYS